MFVIVAVFEIRPEAADAFLARVRRQAADSLANEPQCRRFDVCVDPERPERVMLYELYDDAAAFDAHMATAHFASFDADAAPMVAAKRVERWALA